MTTEPEAPPPRAPLLRRRHLLRSPAWFLSTGAVVLVLALIVGAITWFNGGFELAP